MKSEAKAQREREIFAAAHKLLDQGGAKGLSMLAVARAAKASNETLYSWYGDKIGLFRALIADNTARVETALHQARELGVTPLEQIQAVGPVFLNMVLSDRAVALNRAAAADTTGTLGAALAEGGRARVGPMLQQIFGAAVDAGAIHGAPSDITQTYTALLIGDLQIRRATRIMDAPTEAFCNKRAEFALRALLLTFPAPAEPDQGSANSVSRPLPKTNTPKA